MDSESRTGEQENKCMHMSCIYSKIKNSIKRNGRQWDCGVGASTWSMVQWFVRFCYYLRNPAVGHGQMMKILVTGYDL